MTTVAATPQPDQQPELWNDHVAVYEAVFEPLTLAFARHALDRLSLRPGVRLLDLAAGSGGAALAAADDGAEVLAVDASARMVARLRARAREAGVDAHVRGEVMDGTALALADGDFDAAVSVLGVILFPDAVAGMREMARILKPGGRAAVVTWTAPERYELIARLLGAIAAVRGPQPPPASLPAQLRFRDEAEFRALFGAADLRVDAVLRVEEQLRAPSARWLASHMSFAPGMAALMRSLGGDHEHVMAKFVESIELDQGTDEIALGAVAFVGVATKPV
jgi:SAM-dependent methyltransferase